MVYFLILVLYSLINWLIGFYGVYLGDIDLFDINYCVNNFVVYILFILGGVIFSGFYGMGEMLGSVGNGFIWSFVVCYVNGLVGVGVGFMCVNNLMVGGGVWGVNLVLFNNGS